MESSGQRPAEPEVPLADAAIATEIAHAAARGRGADRAPTLEQLLAAFGETEPTSDARRRVRAALQVAGMGVRPDVLNAEPGQRLLLLPPGAGGNRSRGRAVGGLLALLAILGIAVGAAALMGGGGNGQRASDDLPSETSGFPVQGGSQASTTAPAGTETTGTATATETTTETTPAATEPTAAEVKAKRHERAVRIRRERAARQRAAAAKKTVTVRVDATARPTFLCVDDGAGKQLFGGTLTGKQTFKGKRVRLNIGLASTLVSVNGTPVRLDGSPAGLDVTRTGGARALPGGKRPCS
ncbi:MAG TPA: hypothetical protein VK501_07440 [Baekduia sp.]|uniref:hypothetical protein n=1 Tax=Baekduia sp. TaxID=2600305 RepID=UPI002C0B872E|nr:hypothetical protein [Baekduia sp.]HMJ33735.1 hypothetical protein [Baekduia sp.]